jgi:hypothetical protein
MALLSDGIKEKEFDVRMVQRALNKGLVQQDDIDKHLKKLPDDSANCYYMNLETLSEGVSGKSGLRD